MKYEIGLKEKWSWMDISTFIGTRTPEQCRSHHQKVKKLKYNPEVGKQKPIKTCEKGTQY